MRKKSSTPFAFAFLLALTLASPVILLAQTPQGSLSANGPLCGSGNGMLTWTATAGTGPFSVVYNDGVSNRTQAGVISAKPFAVFSNPVSANTTYTLVSVTDAGGQTRTSGFTGGSATITVKPKPDVTATPASQSVCSGSNITTIALSGSVGGTTYSWSRDNIAGITGGGGLAAFSGTGNISGSFTSTLASPTGVNIKVVPSKDGCAGNTLNVVVTVNNAPTVDDIPNQVVCNGYSTSPVNFTGTATTYKWQNTISGIGLPSSGTGNIASFTAVNTSNSPKTSVVTVTPSTATPNCTGIAKTFTIIVNPSPELSGTLTKTVCSGALFEYAPNTNTPGTNPKFTWSRAAVAGISNSAADGAGSISEKLVNTTASPVNVTYVYMVSVDNNGVSCNSPSNLVVTVKPTPSIKISPSGNQNICSGTPISPVTITNPNGLAGTTFSWTRTNGTMGTGIITGIPSSGSSNPISGTLNNEGLRLDTTVFMVNATNNGCISSDTFQVGVKLPIVNNKVLTADISQVAFCGLNKQITIATQKPDGATGSFTYQWQVRIPPSTNFTDIPGATDSTVVYVTNSDAYFRRIVYSGNCTDVSPEKLVSGAGGPSSFFGSCTGGSGVDMTVVASYTGVIYTLQNDNTGSWVNVANQQPITGNGRSIVFENNKLLGHYRVVATLADKSCSTVLNGSYELLPDIIPDKPSSATATPAVICSGQSTNLVGIVPGATAENAASLYWYTVPSGGAPINPVPVLSGANYTVSPVETTTYYAKSIYASTGCKSSLRTSVQVIVNPTPKMTSPDSVAICTGGTVSIPLTDDIGGGATTYTWVATDNPATTGESTTAQHTATLSNTITNSTNELQTVTYTVIPTVTATGCAGNIPAQIVKVYVAPMPVIQAQAVAACSGTEFIVSPVNGGGNVVPVSPATTYTWSAPTGSGFTGGEGGTGETIRGTLNNSTAEPVTATYSVIPSGGGCTGAPFTATVTVNPAPVISNQALSTCNGSAFSMPDQFFFSGSNIVPTGTFYSWDVPTGTNISGMEAGNHQLAISGQINNTSSPAVPATATYIITPTGPASMGNCAGPDFNLVVTIQPTQAGTNAVWTGTVSSEWCNAANWACGQIPNESVSAIVPAGTPHQPSIQGACNAVVNDIDVQGTATLNIGSGAGLDIYGAIINVDPTRYTLDGIVTFAGSDQNIPGFTYTGLDISGGGTKTLLSAARVNGDLNLNNGIVVTSNAIMLTAAGNVSPGSNASYIEGPLTRITNAASTYNFPVGAGGAIRPATITPTGSGTSSYTIYYHPAATGGNVPGPDLLAVQTREYWDITKNSGGDASFAMYYQNPNGLPADALTDDWSNGQNPCNNCNAVVTVKDGSGNWNITSGAGFSSSQSTYWQTNNFVDSRQLLGAGGQFTFGYVDQVILPVRLISFTGSLHENNGLLLWKYADGREVASTELQHSTDGRNFGKLTVINSSNANDYTYTHNNLTSGPHYYRLLMKDNMGKVSYSQTVLLIAGGNITVITGIRPTMVHSETFIQIHSAKQQPVEASILDMTGRNIGQYKGNLVEGENSFRINAVMLSRGLYTVSVKTADGAQANLRFVKE